MTTYKSSEEVTTISKIPYEIRFYAVNSWTIPLPIKDKWFDRYYILHWEGVYLADKVRDGIVEHDGTYYKINWIDVPSICYKSDQVALSFRRIYGKQEGYVLIRRVG